MSPKIYLDANVFIYFVEGEAAVAAAMRELFVALEQHPSRALTSELTLAEVLAPPRRPIALSLASKQKQYLDLIVHQRFVQLEPISRDILIETASLRQSWPQKLADAIHIVSALRGECDFFMSGDADTKRLPEGMTWLPPNAEGVKAFLDALA